MKRVRWSYREERRTGPDDSAGEGRGVVLRFLVVRLVETAELTLRERSKRPSFSILSRFSLILSSLDCSYSETLVSVLGVWPLWTWWPVFTGDSRVSALFLRVGIVSEDVSLSLSLAVYEFEC